MQVNVEELYRKYAPMVLRRCRFLLRGEDRALDAMQEVFVKLLQNKDRLNAEYPSSLLYTMATNLCLNLIRSEKRHPETKDEELLLAIAGKENIEKKVLSEKLLDQFFEEEEESTRTIAVMHLVDRMTLEETAEAVGLSVSGVRKRLAKMKENSQYECIREAFYGG